MYGEEGLKGAPPPPSSDGTSEFAGGFPGGFPGFSGFHPGGGTTFTFKTTGMFCHKLIKGISTNLLVYQVSTYVLFQSPIRF